MSGSNQIVIPPAPVPAITATGVSVPLYSDYYNYLIQCVQAIYGSDINIDPDSQDGQYLGIQALAMYDAANATAAAYNAMSPQTAQGVGLSSVVKINGIAREVATQSTVLLTLTGQIGRTITNGIVADTNNNQWSLPPSVTFTTSTTINVTATAVNAGAITAAANTVTSIVTPTAGWYTVTNGAAAVPGQPVELDGALRQRQTYSTALPSQALVNGLNGALLALPDVTNAVVYENSTNSTDANGTAAHTVWCVVQGGINSAIGTTIATEKSIGCGTRGAQSFTYNPPNNQPPITVNYDLPTNERIIVNITIKALSAYTSSVGVEIQNAIAAYINTGPGIGGVVEWDECIINAKLPGNSDGNSFRVQSLSIAIYGSSPTQADITLTPGQIATCAVGDITLTVT